MHYLIVVCADEEDLSCIEQAFHAQPGKPSIKVFHQGKHFFDHILNLEKINLPFLIIIDQYLPNEDSLQLLKELKANSRLKLIPVAIMSGFVSKTFTREYSREYYLAGANCFYKKPLDRYEWNHMADCLMTLFLN